MRELGEKPNLNSYIMLVFAAWTILTCFSRLGDAPVYIENEVREGIYVRAMFDTGNFILPEVPNHVESGEIIPDKPPLFHWIATATTVIRSILTTGRLHSRSTLSREFDEWLLRSPSAICGVIMVFSIILLGRPLISKRAAFLAAGCLLTSWQFIHQSRYGRVDMPLACFVTLTMLFVGRAMMVPAKWHLKAAAAMSGLAVLAKGPLGLVLPFFASGVWVVLETRRRCSIRWLGQYPWVVAAFVWLLIALPWYLAAYHLSGMAVVRSQLINENFRQGIIGATARMGVFSYVVPWLRESFPWNLMALAGIWEAWRRRDQGALFCTVWWISFMVVFHIAAYKRRAYLLPALPASSLLAGYWLDIKLPVLGNTISLIISWLRVRWKYLALSVLVAAAIVGYMVRLPWVIALAGIPVPLKEGMITGASFMLLTVAVGCLIYALRMHHAWLSILSLWAGLSVFFVGIVVSGYIVVALRTSPLPLVERILHDLPPNASITVRGVVRTANMLVLFYFPDPDRIHIVPDDAPMPKAFAPGYYLISRQELDNIRKVEPQAAWEELWTDVLKERGLQVRVVMLRKI